MEPEDTSLPRLSCPPINMTRYSPWRDYMDAHDRQPSLKKYFFALNLHKQSAAILPRLLGSVIEVIRFLGTYRCALSIVESGRSTDGTFEILASLRTALEGIGLEEYYFESSDINPGADGIVRSEAMAELRNLAIRPLIAHMWAYNEHTTAIFLDDVAACPDDILELMYQRDIQNVVMTCAMDWVYPEGSSSEPFFHDIWTARGITGEAFFRIPDDGDGTLDYTSAGDLFWNDEYTLSRLRAGKPFQVFSCWNGAVSVGAHLFTRGPMRFRAHRDGECPHTGTLLFCKGVWSGAIGPIAVIPSVNLAYSDEEAARVKEVKGYVQNWTVKASSEDRYDAVSTYLYGPPEMLRCMSAEGRQRTVPWDEGLFGRNGTT